MELTFLSKTIYSYEFFQIIYLLENNCIKENINLEEKLHLQSTSELNFPAVDLQEFFIDEQNEWYLTVNFMGLLGVDSPLPQYFFAELIQDDEISRSIKKFLNIFNRRIYFLLYFAWKKYRTTLCAKQQKLFSSYFQKLSGNLLQLSDKGEFTYAAQLGARIHPRQQLKMILQEFLQLNTLEIIEFVPTWVELNAINYLGAKTLRLADNTILGNRCLLLDNHVRIIIQDIELKDLEKILPHTAAGKRLQQLLQRYLPIWQTYSLIIQIRTTKLSCLLLGCADIKLGLTSWLGETSNIFYACASTSLPLNLKE